MKTGSRGWKFALLIALIVLADQAVKIYIKTHFQLYESVRVFDWFYLSFTENNGMAFGWEFFDKIFLTLFRLVVCGLLIWYMSRLCPQRDVKGGYLTCLALIIAGAMGNIVDCMFYGLIFDDSLHHVASFQAFGEGYAPFLRGKVVDMLYFPLIDTVLPDWVPIWGGRPFVFFRPVFNLADSSITIGVLALLLFHPRELFAETPKETPAEKPSAIPGKPGKKNA